MIRKVKFLWENHAPLLGAVVGLLLAYFAGGAIYINGGFLSALATVMVILCGLSGVSISILLVSQLDVFVVFRRMGFQEKLIGMVKITVFSSLFSSIGALVGLLNTKVAANSIYVYILFSLSAGAIFAFMRMFLSITKAGIIDAIKKRHERWGDKSD